MLKYENEHKLGFCSFLIEHRTKQIGVFVSRVKEESLASLLGAGDRILELNGRRITGENSAAWVQQELRKRRRVQLKLAPFQSVKVAKK